jgi:hypothetical protein
MDDDHRSNLSVITNWIYKEVSGVSINIRIFRAVKKKYDPPYCGGKTNRRNSFRIFYGGSDIVILVCT